MPGFGRSAYALPEFFPLATPRSLSFDTGSPNTGLIWMVRERLTRPAQEASAAAGGRGRHCPVLMGFSGCVAQRGAGPARAVGARRRAPGAAARARRVVARDRGLARRLRGDGHARRVLDAVPGAHRDRSGVADAARGRGVLRIAQDRAVL